MELWERDWYEKAIVNYTTWVKETRLSLKAELIIDLLKKELENIHVLECLKNSNACYEWFKWNLLTITNSFKRGGAYYYNYIIDL